MPKQSDTNRRHAMVERQVLEAIASYISRDIKDEFPGLMTISRVVMATDLKAAKVFVSVLTPGEDEDKMRGEAVELLQDFAGEIQREVDRQLRLRFTPKLTFCPDETTKKILHIESVLHSLRGANSAGDGEGVAGRAGSSKDETGGDDE